MLLTMVENVLFAQNDSLHNKEVQLDSVVVISRRPVVKTNGNITKVRIKGTVYSDMGNITDMLGQLPGLTTTEKGIEVLGCGVPVYEIDGRILQQTEALKVMKSRDVEYIEIDRAPSSEYSANTNSVIRIKTVKRISDNLYLGFDNDLNIRRKVSETPSVDLKFKKKIFTSSLSYSFSWWRNLNKETYFRNIIHPQYTFKSTEAREAPSLSRDHNILWSNEMQLNAKHLIGIGYYGLFENGNNDEIGSDTYEWANSTTLKNISRLDKQKKSTNSISLYYNFDVSENSHLNFTSDYAVVNNKHDINLYETQNATTHKTWTETRNKYYIWTNNLKYKFKMPGDVSTTIGFLYSDTRSSSQAKSDNEYLMDGNYFTRINNDENTAATFVTASKKWEKLSVTGGLRYEYTHRKVTGEEGTDALEDVKQSYSNLYPRLTIQYRPSYKWTLIAYYVRYINHPAFSSLSPIMLYTDSLAYRTGNAELKSTVDDYIGANVIWRNLSLGIYCKFSKNPIINPEICKEEDGNVIVATEMNSSSGRDWYVSLSYSKTINKFMIYARAAVGIPDYDIDYANYHYHVGKANINFNANCSYDINSNWAIFTSFSYNSYKERFLLSQRPVNKWDVGIRCKLLKNKLSANLQFTDILNGAHYNNTTSTFRNVSWGTRGTNDFRGISLRLSYTIFDKDIQSNSRRENNELLQRAR